LAQKVTRQKGLKKIFLEWVKNLPEEEFRYLWPENSKEEIMLFWSKERKEENIACKIGSLSYKYLTKWPNEEEKYEKAAQLLSLIPKGVGLLPYAFQYIRSCVGWFPGFDHEKLESALKRYGL